MPQNSSACALQLVSSCKALTPREHGRLGIAWGGRYHRCLEFELMSYPIFQPLQTFARIWCLHMKQYLK